MKMEILLEPTSNKLMVVTLCDLMNQTFDNWKATIFNTTVGNPVKKILLKLNLSDHRLFKDGGGEDGIDIYMLVEKEYPLSRGTLTLMLVVKLLVEQDSEMSRELLRKIFMQVERPRR
ncbi:hypothetical protein Tco_0090886 [Tanacetum coccineum]